MANKRITIDMKAYKTLKAVRRGDETFSDTIKRLIKDPDEVLRALKELGKNPLSDEAINAIEQVVAERRRPHARARRRAS